ncbi:MAG: hypothetical protein ACRDOH_07460, partial [Streptosporangiaceae bacterium]
YVLLDTDREPGTCPPRSRAFDIGCALFAAVASFGTFSFAQTEVLVHPAEDVLLAVLSCAKAGN